MIKKVIVKYYDEHPTWPSTVKEKYDSVPEGWVEMTVQEYNDAVALVKDEMEAHFDAIREQHEQQMQAELDAKAQEEAEKQAQKEAEFQAFLDWKESQGL